MLSSKQIDDYNRLGFVKLDRVVPAHLCEEIIDVLWRDMEVDRNDRSTWTRPVIRLGDYSSEPFRQAANVPVLHEAFDQLVGPGKWIPRGSLGTFPVRFPSSEDPGDTGWHVDASFPGTDVNDIFSWRINVHSRGRAMLMLFLFSDVGDADAPTKIKNGSHKEVEKLLRPYGDVGLSFMELASLLHTLPEMNESLATGAAGTVYLCHPFVVHAAQEHRGTHPKFMAQPPLLSLSSILP